MSVSEYEVSVYGLYAEADPGEGLRGLQPPFENFFFFVILPDSSQNNNRIKLFLQSYFTFTI